MYEKELFSLTFEQIIVFLEAARYENFTRASESFHMSQANVSHVIDKLELSTGLILFIRDKQRVRLSPAGKALLEDWSRIAKSADASLKNAYQIQKGALDQLRVGDYGTTEEGAYLLPVLNAFEAAMPAADVSVVRTNPIDVLYGLVDGRFDVVFFSRSGEQLIRKAGAKVALLKKVKPSIVIACGHRLFEKPVITADDLREETLVAMNTQGPYVEYWASVEDILAKTGFAFKNVRYADNEYTMSFELKHNHCVALMDTFYRPFDRSDLRYIELEECDEIYGFLLAYMPGNRNPMIRAFIKSAIAESKNL